MTTTTTLNPLSQFEPSHLPYAVGDLGKLEDMATAPDDNIIIAAANLKPNDPCFVLRSDGRYTFARVVSCQFGVQRPCIELQVDEAGCMKRIPLHLCWKYVRQMHHNQPTAATVQGAAEPLCQSYRPRRRHQRTRQRNLNTPFTRGFRTQIDLPTRRPSLSKGFSSSPNLRNLSLEMQNEEFEPLGGNPSRFGTLATHNELGSQSGSNLLDLGLSWTGKKDPSLSSSFSKELVMNKNRKSSITDHRQLNEELNRALLDLGLSWTGKKDSSLSSTFSKEVVMNKNRKSSITDHRQLNEELNRAHFGLSF